MDETDAFFTQTIVGAPLSVWLGRRQGPPDAQASGLVVDLASGEAKLSTLWQEWAVLSHADDPLGRPRHRPGRVRRVLERHALAIAMLGFLALLCALALLGYRQWT